MESRTIRIPEGEEIEETMLKGFVKTMDLILEVASPPLSISPKHRGKIPKGYTGWVSLTGAPIIIFKHEDVEDAEE